MGVTVNGEYMFSTDFNIAKTKMKIMKLEQTGGQ